MAAAAISALKNAVWNCKEEICGLPSADCKTHALLILGRVLQAAAIVAFGFTLGYAFVAGPAVLVGLVPAIYLGMLGTCAAEKGTPFVPGQPVGLYNGRNNCWLNSGLQILANVPALARRLRQSSEFVPFLDAYEAARAGQQKAAASIDTHQIRQILSRGTNGQIDPGNVQEDAAQVFEYIFQGRNSLFTFDQQIDGNAATTRHEPMVQLQMGRGTPILSFEQMFNNFFDSVTDRGQRQRLFFRRAPEDFVVQCRRFYQDQEGRLRKISDPIEIPERLPLPARFVRSGEHPTYACDAFLSHNGYSPDEGHYDAYIKVENRWWHCCDAKITQVSETRAKAAMKYGYILHFSRPTS